MTETLHDCDHIALTKLLATRPGWHSNETAATALNLDPSVILHAGPPFNNPDEIPEPVLNSAAVALVYENQADDFKFAKRMIRSGEVSLRPAQDHSTVVPLAGVVSSSMWLHRVIDLNNPQNSSYSPLNGGNGPAMRLGLCSDSALAHLRWINNELIATINECLSEPINLLNLAEQALRQGDDCHGRTIAATKILVEQFESKLDNFPVQKTFLEESPSFALNLLMAAAKCLLLAADNHTKSSVITAAGGNGSKMGLKLANNPEQWVTVEAQAPTGDLGSFSQSRALGAIGDSAVVDLIGFGAMALNYAPAQHKLFLPHLPDDASVLVNTLLPCVHKGFGKLQFKTGLTARTVVEKNTTPIVSLGVIDNEGQDGRLGGGIYRYPMTIFQKALETTFA